MKGKDTRWTKQLKVILNFIYESDRPVTAVEVFQFARKLMPKISLGTVYRNMRKLVNEGLVSEVLNNGISTFCRHPFPNTTFECNRCHKLVSVPVEIDTLVISNSIGMMINKWSLHLNGMCKECATRCI